MEKRVTLEIVGGMSRREMFSGAVKGWEYGVAPAEYWLIEYPVARYATGLSFCAESDPSLVSLGLDPDRYFPDFSRTGNEVPRATPDGCIRPSAQ